MWLRIEFDDGSNSYSEYFNEKQDCFRTLGKMCGVYKFRAISISPGVITCRGLGRQTKCNLTVLLTT